MFCLALAALAVLAALAPAGAAEYSYHPSATMRLGAGTNPRDPLDTYPYCFTFSDRKVLGTGGIGQFSLREVRDRRQLMRDLNASASLAGQYKFFSGSAKGSLDEGYSFSSDSLTWMIYLSSDFGRRELFDEVLTSAAQTLLTDNKHNEFAERCGPELVSQERRGGLVAAIFTVSNVSESRRKTLEASLDATVKAGLFSGEGAATYRSFVAEAAKSSAIALDVRVIGGPGGPALSALITDSGDLRQITQVLREYASKIDADNALTVGYSTTRMSRYGYKGDTLDVTKSDLSLGDYYLFYQDLQSLRERASSLLRANSEGKLALQPLEVQRVRDVEKRSDELMRSVIDKAKSCRSDESKCVSVTSFERVTPNWPQVEPVGNVSVLRNNVTCQEIGPVTPSFSYMCSETVQIRAATRPAEIQNISVVDERGAGLISTISAPADVGSYVESMKYIGTAVSPSTHPTAPNRSEADIVEEITVRGVRGVDEARGLGWRIQVINIELTYGANSSSPRPKARTLIVRTAGQNGGFFDRAILLE